MSYTDDSLPVNQILCGDNLELIKQLPDCSIQLVMTSPPYFQQRDYGGGMGNENDVNDYAVKGNKHPAIYPVELVEEFLHLLTPPNSIVLDPFMGSGSTAVACKNLDRHYIGYDINPDYCKYAQQRVSDVPTEKQYRLEKCNERQKCA